MVETFGAHYVSLHVRVSNQAAIHLYKETLGFATEKTEAKYYADGEDAYSMRLDLSSIREQIQEDKENEEGEGTAAAANNNGEDGGKTEGVDEGDAVGDVGSDPNKKKKNGTGDGEEKRKVKVGRALGVGELVERDESKHAS